MSNTKTVKASVKKSPSAHHAVIKNKGSGLVHFYVHQPIKPDPCVLNENLTVPSIIKVVENGLPVKELTDLRESLDVSTERLAPMLGISKATLHRQKGAGKRLDPSVSDRVVRFARLLGKARQVFGDLEDAKQWLRSSQFGLGGAVPLDYARTEVGAREVENLLGRIEYGVYS
jgi:putative toxin-antitoxin system antitoxin component (TIGR02293 family)